MSQRDATSRPPFNDDGYRARGLRTLCGALRDVRRRRRVRARNRAEHHEPFAHPDATPSSSPGGERDFRGGWNAGRLRVRGAERRARACYRARPISWSPGMNHGLNLATDVFYSGTVAAAREGALRGIPAMAASADDPGADIDACGRIRRAARARRFIAARPVSPAEQRRPPGAALSAQRVPRRSST